MLFRAPRHLWTASTIFSHMCVFQFRRHVYCKAHHQCKQTELLDQYVTKDGENEFELTLRHVTRMSECGKIGIRESDFTWSNNPSELAKADVFVLKVSGEVRFVPGAVNLITGPPGSGKTSLLMALLGMLVLVHLVEVLG